MYNSKYLLPKILLHLCKASPLTMSTTNFIKHDTYTFLVMQTKGKPCSKYRQIMSSFYLHGNCFYQVHGCCFIVFYFMLFMTRCTVKKSLSIFGKGMYTTSVIASFHTTLSHSKLLGLFSQAENFRALSESSEKLLF